MGEKLLFLVGGNREGGKNSLGLKKKEREKSRNVRSTWLLFIDSLLDSRPEKHASKVERGLAESSIRERRPSGSTVK